MKAARIQVHIERLVLDGIDLAAGDGELIGGAVQAELERLVAADRKAADAATVQTARRRPVTRPGDTAALGPAIASAIHERIRPDAHLTRGKATP